MDRAGSSPPGSSPVRQQRTLSPSFRSTRNGNENQATAGAPSSSLSREEQAATMANRLGGLRRISSRELSLEPAPLEQRPPSAPKIVNPFREPTVREFIAKNPLLVVGGIAYGVATAVLCVVVPPLGIIMAIGGLMVSVSQVGKVQKDSHEIDLIRNEYYAPIKAKAKEFQDALNAYEKTPAGKVLQAELTAYQTQRAAYDQMSVGERPENPPTAPQLPAAIAALRQEAENLVPVQLPLLDAALKVWQENHPEPKTLKDAFWKGGRDVIGFAKRNPVKTLGFTAGVIVCAVLCPPALGAITLGLILGMCATRFIATRLPSIAHNDVEKYSKRALISPVPAPQLPGIMPTEAEVEGPEYPYPGQGIGVH